MNDTDNTTNREREPDHRRLLSGGEHVFFAITAGGLFYGMNAWSYGLEGSDTGWIISLIVGALWTAAIFWAAYGALYIQGDLNLKLSGRVLRGLLIASAITHQLMAVTLEGPLAGLSQTWAIIWAAMYIAVQALRRWHKAGRPNPFKLGVLTLT